jgi:hypothetical protein
MGQRSLRVSSLSNEHMNRSQSISTIGSRLEQLEGAISGIHRSLQRLDPTTLAAAQAPASSILPPTQSVVSTLNSTGPPLQYHVVHESDGCERYYGPASLASLIHNMDALMLDHLCVARSLDPDAAESAAATAREKIRRLASIDQDLPSRLVNDGSVLKEPPLVILEALIDPYFETVSLYMPIFTRSGFRRLVAAAHEGGDAAHDRAFAVCSNNLVLLTLTAKALHSRARSGSGANIDRGPSIESDLIRSFVGNASRAIVNIEQLLRPRLINVQALLSLVCFSSTPSQLLLR